MIKVIVFDLHGVLGRGTTADLVELVSEKLSISKELAEKGIRNEKRIDTYLGKYTIQEYWQEFINVVGDKRFSVEELVKLHINSFTPDEKMLDLLKKLKGKYALVLLTNNIKEKFEALNEKYNFDDYFDVIIISCYCDMRKPNPEIFKIACEQASCNPDEMLLVDDLKRNTIAAEEFGMRTIHFENYEILLKRLKEKDY